MRNLSLGLVAALVAWAPGAAAATAPNRDGSRPAEEPLAGPPAYRDAEAPLDHFSSLTLAGTAFRPASLSSATELGYDGAGCVHRVAGERSYDFPLELPAGSVIHFVDVYYYDASPDNLVVELDQFTPSSGGSTLTRLGGTFSSGSSGYGATGGADLNHPVDTTKAYVLRFFSPGTDNSLQLCVVQVRYVAPLIFRDGFESRDVIRWSAAVP